MKLYFRLLKYLKPYKWRFMAAYLCMILFSLFSVLSLSAVIPFMGKVLMPENSSIVSSGDTSELLEDKEGRFPEARGWIKEVKEDVRIKTNDFFDSHSRKGMLFIIVVALLVFTLLRGMTSFGREYLMAYVGQGVVKDLRLALYEKIQLLSLDYFSHSRTGMIISRLTNDVGFVDRAVAALRALLQQSLLAVVFILTMFIFVPWKLAVSSMIIVPFIAYPTARIGKKIRIITTRSQEKMADIYSLLQETISGVHIVRAFSMENYEIGKFKRENYGFFKVMMKSMKRKSGLTPLVDFLSVSGAAAVLLYGGLHVLKGELSPENFIFFLIILASLIPPFSKLSRVNVDIQEGLSAGKRIFQILDTEPTVRESKNAFVLSPLKEGIKLIEVGFSYDKKPILTNINLSVRVGEIIALVGPTGTGKTSLVNLIPRFYDPISGRIEIDGQDIRGVTLKSLREQMGIVTQDTILFNDTVRRNIAYGREDISSEAIAKAARAANAHHFIMKMPEGYETKIGDRGVRLSGGERQRLAIARAILKDPAILILDEATSALDSESERLVQEALDKLMKGRTTFVIAHRLSTVRKADKIIVLNEEKICEEGRHEELMKKEGLYKKLYRMQFQQED